MSTENLFGAFVRTTRKALGLNLREFCRRNGFDPGNISRLERGLTPPPQGEEALAALAKALKLKSTDERWERFQGLAAAANGRIPPDLLKGNTKAAQLPSFFRKIRGGQGHRNSVQAYNLEQWADTIAARSTLPQLVRRLVHATGSGVTYREFPAGDQVQRPGWDGVVEATGTDEFVPAGVSRWEMGTDKDKARKFEKDFAKWNKNARGRNKRNTAFVFVTPRKWQEKENTVKAKAKLRIWKEVRVYDSATLEEWLERAPAVDKWLARILGIQHDAGLMDLDEHWENLAAVTDPSLRAEVFLASRAEEVEHLKKWLEGPPDALVIETMSPGDAVDFVAAFSRSPIAREALTARALIVESREAWRAMAASGSKLVLIAHPILSLEPELVAEAVRQGHHVILCSERTANHESKIQLPRVYRYDLQKALETCGLEHSKAGDYAGKAGGSLTVLKRLLSRYPGTTKPEWSRPSVAGALVPFLLAGSWEETTERDRLALERLSATPYDELASVAEQWLHAPDPPLTRVLSRLSLVSRDDSWFLLADALTQDHLRRFEQVAIDVLSEEDPAYELPTDQRWQAALHGKVLRHSQALRTGLSEALALLGGRPDLVPGRVAHIVRTLLDGKDWKRWASLSPQLPLLAEAAPDAFLEAVERDLRRSNSALVKLFEQEGNAFLSFSPHTGLLWAMEGLAWNSSLLPRVAYVLAQLDELAPPGKRGNHPMRSLRAIFLPWFPQTTATVEDRVKVLSAIAKKQPDTGWRLLAGLLPNLFATATPIQRPMFRDWALKWSKGASNADYWFQVNATANLLVDLLGNDLGRWKQLIEQIEFLPGPARSKFLEHLACFNVEGLEYDSRREIAEVLREKVARQHRFAETDWGLPEEIVSDLERAQQRFQPDDLIARHAWLFDRIEEEIDTNKKGEATSKELRQAALRDIETVTGWKGVLALGEMVRFPKEVGWIVGENGSTDLDIRILPNLLTGAEEKLAHFAEGYTQTRFHTEGWPWVDSFDMSNWSIEQMGEFALQLPRHERRTWDFVCSKGAGVEKHYWSRMSGSSQCVNPDDVAFAVEMLIKYNSPPIEAFRVLAMALLHKITIEPGHVMDALEAGSESKAVFLSRDNVRYRIIQLFRELQRQAREHDTHVDVQRLAGLEWQYLGLLDGQLAKPAALYRMLQGDPRRFVELLSFIFSPTSESGEPKVEPTDEEKARGQNAYRLLMSWDQIPGSREDGTIDDEVLLAWIREARQRAKEADRLEICESMIGELLARHDHKEEDGSWPCIPIRDALEEVGTEDVFDGFAAGIFNRQGAYNKSLTEGGEQERTLAQLYRAWADQCKIDWPNTASSLQRVAEGYEEQARREDAKTLLK